MPALKRARRAERRREADGGGAAPLQGARAPNRHADSQDAKIDAAASSNHSVHYSIG
jgi:hypothetical protein